MQYKLTEILSNYSLEDAIKTEENDRQFLAIKNMNEKIGNSDYFFPLIITNALVGYQLSSSGEDYWEELAEVITNYELLITNNSGIIQTLNSTTSEKNEIINKSSSFVIPQEYFLKGVPLKKGIHKIPLRHSELVSESIDILDAEINSAGRNKAENFSFQLLYNFFEDFLPKSRGNKRLLNMKIPRIKKLDGLFEKIIGNFEFYYQNLGELQNMLAKQLKQKKDDKTILFAVKMFYYAAKIHFGYQIIIPFDIGIPLDSRLAKLEKIYNTDNLPRQVFWQQIATEINIPPLHLDGLIWTRCNEFLCI